jgi:hypothetical protein
MTINNTITKPVDVDAIIKSDRYRYNTNTRTMYYYDSPLWKQIDIYDHFSGIFDRFSSFDNIAKAVCATVDTPVEFDQCNLLAFKNGVYDLCAKKFRDIKKTDYLTKTVGYMYDPTVTNTELDEFVSTTFNPDTKEKFYDMVADIVNMRNARLHILQGAGANGKSVAVNLIKLLLGEYAERYRKDIRYTIYDNPPERDGNRLLVSEDSMFSDMTRRSINFYTDSGRHVLYATNRKEEIVEQYHNPPDTLEFTNVFVDHNRKNYTSDKLAEFRMALMNNVLSR